MAIFQGVRAGFVTLAGGCIHGCRKGFCPDADGAPNFVFSLLRGPYNHRRGSSPGIVFSSVARFLGVLETKEFVTNLPPPTLRAGYGSPFLFGTVFVPRPFPLISLTHPLSLSLTRTLSFSLSLYRCSTACQFFVVDRGRRVLSLLHPSHFRARALLVALLGIGSWNPLSSLKEDRRIPA